MTKKSQGRLQRDALKQEQDEKIKDNVVWNDTVEIQQQCLQLLQANLTIGSELGNQNLIPFYNDYRSVCINMRTLAGDLQRVATEYQSIAGKHVGKQGAAKDMDEFMLAIKIHEQYAAWLEHFNGVVLPTIVHLIEELGIATQRLIEHNKQVEIDAQANQPLAPEQDPNVITDAVILDSSNTAS